LDQRSPFHHWRWAFCRSTSARVGAHRDRDRLCHDGFPDWAGTAYPPRDGQRPCRWSWARTCHGLPGTHCPRQAGGM